MFKLVGFVMILLADFIIIKYMSDAKIKEIQFLRDTLTFLKNLTVQTVDLKRPLYEAVMESKGAVSHEIDGIISRFIEKRERQCLVTAYSGVNFMDSGAKKAVCEYLNVLGRVGKESAADFLKVTVDRINVILNEKHEKMGTQRKVSSAAVYSVSVFLMILIW
jgi:hypothetical protein